jgi:transposase
MFLHSPRRVEAFAYVMLLALLLYCAFEHVIRSKMKNEQEPLVLPGKRKSYKPDRQFGHGYV